VLTEFHREKKVKISSVAKNGINFLHSSYPEHDPLFSTLRQTMRSFFAQQDKIQIAIDLDETGNVQDAKAILKKHAE
jgi:hypothetical protein